jgi:hypothetical protein
MQKEKAPDDRNYRGPPPGSKRIDTRRAEVWGDIVMQKVTR